MKFVHVLFLVCCLSAVTPTHAGFLGLSKFFKNLKGLRDPDRAEKLANEVIRTDDQAGVNEAVAEAVAEVPLTAKGTALEMISSLKDVASGAISKWFPVVTSKFKSMFLKGKQYFFCEAAETKDACKLNGACKWESDACALEEDCTKRPINACVRPMTFENIGNFTIRGRGIKKCKLVKKDGSAFATDCKRASP